MLLSVIFILMEEQFDVVFFFPTEAPTIAPAAPNVNPPARALPSPPFVCRSPSSSNS